LLVVSLTLVIRVWVGLQNRSAIELAAGTDLEYDASQVSWILHNGTVIIVLASSSGSTLHVSTASQNGSWSEITQGPNDTVVISTFRVFIEHGRSTQPSFAAYAQLPGVYADAGSADAVASAFLASVADVSYDERSPFICRYQANASLLWMVMGTFFEPSLKPMSPMASCPSISTSAACTFMVALHVTGVMSVTLSNPYRDSAAASIVAVIHGMQASGPFCVPSADGTAVTVNLPSGSQSGSSSTVSCIAS
jgi:hypothetical protein